MPENADSMKLAEVINNTAAELLRGILRAEMLIEIINQREFNDMTGGKIGRIIHDTIAMERAFEVAKEMVIEIIKEREFNDMAAGKIGRIIRDAIAMSVAGRDNG
jgi:protein-arginine kinase activator protein McsA